MKTDPYIQATQLVNRQITQKRYIYVLVIQQNYGFGWEDMAAQYQCNSSGEAYEPILFKRDFKEFQRTGEATRSHYLRIKNPFFKQL